MLEIKGNDYIEQNANHFLKIIRSTKRLGIECSQNYFKERKILWPSYNLRLGIFPTSKCLQSLWSIEKTGHPNLKRT